ncbi:MAG TPA: FAD:protein FMN transferase, partial [Gemmatimonadaceae bacterium]|nr:FAD:protein FMN transferase [Gemmatimonadaceae bacterium]
EAVLRSHDADAQLDLGGIAKGYGVDRAAAILRDWGVRHALVNVGGDLYAIGTAPDGDGWRIGIQDPDDDRRMIATLSLADAAVATSGTYQQFFRWRGRRYHHLLDPATAAPRATGMQSLTVRAASCMHADAAATALFGMSRVEAARVLARCATDGAIMHSV